MNAEQTTKYNLLVREINEAEKIFEEYMRCAVFSPNASKLFKEYEDRSRAIARRARSFVGYMGGKEME
jgi:hypothetical protein